MLLKYHVDVDVLKDVQARDGHLGTELDRIKMAMIEYSTHIYDNAYTQDQILAFGEVVLKEAIKICDYTMNNAQIKQVNGIDISKLLNK